MAASITALPPEPRLMPKDHALWGTLCLVQPVGDGLIQVRVGRWDRLVSATLLKKLQKMIGQRVAIVRIDDEWKAGAL